MMATVAARVGALAGTDLRLIPFTAVLSLISNHVAADTCRPHCGQEGQRITGVVVGACDPMRGCLVSGS